MKLHLFKEKRPMNAKTYKKQFVDSLESLYGIEEAESFFYLILENKHQMKRIDLALNSNFDFSEEDILIWEKIKSRLLKEEPIQYILGSTHFMDLSFKVTPDVLIPRPETEELVEWIINESKNRTKLKILDIGTGSGCIAISLAHHLPDAEVFAIDVSAKALQMAKQNALLNHVEVHFLEIDILKAENLPQQFDIIVSNPPYVRNLEKEEIKNNVLEHEPHLALFVDDFEALIFYKKIAELAIKNLNNNGQLFFEINQYLGREMVQLLEDLQFSNIELRKDIYGNDRMTRANFIQTN